MLKNSLLAASIIAVLTVPAIAGNISEPIMEPTIVIQDVQPTSDSSGILMWLALAALIVVAGN